MHNNKVAIGVSSDSRSRCFITKTSGHVFCGWRVFMWEITSS